MRLTFYKASIQLPEPWMETIEFIKVKNAGPYDKIYHRAMLSTGLEILPDVSIQAKTSPSHVASVYHSY